MARKAKDVLLALEVYPDLASALRTATWTCGTTSRALPNRPQLFPRELAAELWRRSASGEVVVVFGEERRGVSDRELDLCQAVRTIPTDAGYDSMNLAQAVAVVAYEVGLLKERAHERALSMPPAEPARHETVEALWSLALLVLSRTGYLNPQNPEHILKDLRHLLARADPTQREAELITGALRAIERQQRV